MIGRYIILLCCSLLPAHSQSLAFLFGSASVTARRHRTATAAPMNTALTNILWAVGGGINNCKEEQNHA